MKNIEGTWKGSISGTNSGSIVVEVQQHHTTVLGKMEVDVATFGYYTYNIVGFIDDKNMLVIEATKDTKKFGPGTIRILANVFSNKKISGVWINDLKGKGEVMLWKE